MSATDDTEGKIVVAKIGEKLFGIEDEWSTSAFKPLVVNAFMAWWSYVLHQARKSEYRGDLLLI